MSKNSLIYSNIFFYRSVMNILYKGNYRRRFDGIFKLISGKSVTELCFGDTLVADYCKQHKIDWKGIDSNETFISRANKKGYKTELNDINALIYFPKADTCIISGSLYHFHKNIENLFSKLLECAPVIIISEPISNLSNHKGIIGKTAAISATVNGQKQNFRFTKESLLETLSNLSAKLNFNFKVVEQFEKDWIILINR